jgi:hypothetical protein
MVKLAGWQGKELSNLSLASAGATVRYRLSIPARINILGNPGDANEGDFATLSAAVEVRARALVEPAEVGAQWVPRQQAP